MKFKLLIAALMTATLFGFAQNGPVNLNETPEHIARNSFIFVFHNDVDASALPAQASATAQAHGGNVRHVFQNTIKGFSLTVPEHAAQRIFENNPNIAYYERNQVAYAIGKFDEVSKGKPGGGGGSNGQVTPWGITRVNGGISGNFGTAWVVDSGVDLDHPDLNVDVARSATFVARTKDADDQNGHGTHVAGTIAAIDNNSDVIGVAAGATVVAVRVLDRRGSGTFDGVIAGVDYVAANASSQDVANMSLGGGYSQALNDAVEAASRSCAFVVAAGNEGQNANNVSPASASGANVYTISAIDSSDRLASFSNWSVPPVDYAEPGVSILSLKSGGGTTTMSGTSMAAPHAAGLLLLGNIANGGSTNTDPGGDRHTIGVH